MSRGFTAALAGIAMTLFAWFGPWAWPAWPAFTAIHLLFGGNAALAGRPFNERATMVVVLIVINVTFWAGAVYALGSLVRRAMLFRRP